MTPQPTTSAVAPATGRADRLLDLDHPHAQVIRPVADPEPATAASAIRTPVVVAPEIAVQIVAAFTSGTSLAALAHQWHLTPGEVAQVVAGQAYAAAPEVAPEVRVPRKLAAVLLRNVPR